MIVKSDSTDQSLGLLLKGEKAVGNLNALVQYSCDGALEKFKSTLASHICYLAGVVNACILSPKASLLDLEGSLRYLLLYVTKQAELFGRIHYYFEDEEYYSVQAGTMLYNLMISKLASALKYDGFNEAYLRIDYDRIGAGAGTTVNKTIGNTNISLYVDPEVVHDRTRKIFLVKVGFDITNITDPDAWFGFILVDAKAEKKSHVIGARNQGGDRMRKQFTMELPEGSVDNHMQADIIGIVQGRFRMPSLNKKGVTKIPVYTGEVQLRAQPFFTKVKVKQ